MTFKGELRGFQEDACNLMLDRGNLLLAHEMGLGKTVTSIAVTETLIDNGKIENALVVCPASVKWQWARQIEHFSDGALVKVIEGSKAQRRVQYRAVTRADVEYTIVNYEQVINDWEIIRRLGFDLVICDEVQAIKSANAKRTRHMRRIHPKYRFGLSGQPIENRPEELYQIMQWIDPSVLGDARTFERTFIRRNTWGKVAYYRNLKLLRRSMQDAMHRKTWEDPDVAAQMPQVVKEDYVIDFDPKTQRAYRIVAKDLIRTIRAAPKLGGFNVLDHYAGVNNAGISGEVMPRLMALRMLCDHPALLEYSAAQFDDPDTVEGSKYAALLRNTGLLKPLAKSPKLTATLELIEEIFDENPKNKIVLFSFFKPMLAIISKHLKVEHELFTGDMTPREREEARVRFTERKATRVLLSSDAGGVGVDLPAANYLISYDLPWSAGKFKQRQGRIVRLSTEWGHVTLINMVLRDSIEERMAEMLDEKSQIASAWLDGKGLDRKGEFTVALGTLVDFLEDRYYASSAA